MKRCYVQDPVTLELVPKEEYYARQEVSAPMVIPDIAGYKSMQTGEWIGGRRQHREHLKQHRLIEVGNEIKAHLSPQKPKMKGPRAQLIEAVKRHMS